METIIFEKKGDIGILTFNRPKALNALNSQVVSEANALLDEIAKTDIRCLIVTGSGEKAFVAGADIAEMKDKGAADAQKFSEEGNDVMRKLETFPCPVIAAVNGFALGGGSEVALSCDIRLAGENAVFGLPEVSLGIFPGYGGIQRLARTIGLGKARELVFTTAQVKAPEALALGLVNAVYPLADLMPAAEKMAAKIAAMSPFGVRAAKKILNDSIGLELSACDKLESPAFGECFKTADQKEAMTAFVEKRKPAPFTGK